MWYYVNNDLVVEDGILKGGKLIENLIIPNTVKKVLGEKSREDVKDPRFGRDIFYPAFNQNETLKSVEMADSVEIIGEKAFEHAHKLNKVALSKNLKEIRLSAFLGCYSLKEVTIPKSIKRIATWSFELIENLVVHYEGTKKEFNKVDIGNEWCKKGTKVICADAEWTVE